LGIERFATADIGRIFRGQTVTGLSEWQLLQRYLERQDEVAFEALVARHGPMVLGVCRRMLSCQNDVEDAFQATFLVLVRRARQLGPRDAIGPWLYGVASRVALRARCEAARRRRFESIQIDAAASAPANAPADLELAESLDQELSRLPSKYRSPIVLCYLEGQSHEEAARVLKWPVGTVKGRLARARGLLRDRLARRGLAPTMLALCRPPASDAIGSVPRELLESTVRSGLKCAIGHTTGQVVSTSIATLVEGVLTAMFFTKMQWIGAALLISALALAGAGVMAQQERKPLDGALTQSVVPVTEGASTLANAGQDLAATRSPGSGPLALASAERGKSSPAARENAALAPGLSDPEGQLLQAANHAWNKVYSEYASGSGTVDRLHDVSMLLLDAQKQTATTPDETASAIRDHLDRIRSIARLRQKIPHAASTADGDNAKLLAFAAKAELELSQGAGGGFGGGEIARPKKPPIPLGPTGQGKDPKSQMILIRLNDLVPLKFADETPLEDFLKYIKESTKSAAMSHGIPIYVDPLGLQEAEKSMNSTIRIELDGVPLKRTLQLVLKQLGLAYFVEDGMIYITSQESFDQMSHLGPALPEESPLLEEGQKALRGELSVDEMEKWLEKYKACSRVKKALEEDKPDGEALDSHAPAAALDQEIKKLTATNDELKKKVEKLETQLSEIRDLLKQLAKPEKRENEVKKRGGLQ
jgi:RNA polymerase sigma factor (sigma-70 family)